MIDYMLKFSDEQEALSVLFDGETPKFRNIDTIGIITKVVDDTDPDNVVTQALPGWHVNVRALPEEDVEGLEVFAVHPETPARVWA